MDYQSLKDALEILGITERATLEQINQRHRALVKRHHHNRGNEATSEPILRINAAYELIRAYCKNYRYCFTEEEFLEQVPSERLRRQFDSDPIWSGTRQEK